MERTKIQTILNEPVQLVYRRNQYGYDSIIIVRASDMKHLGKIVQGAGLFDMEDNCFLNREEDGLWA